MTGIKEVLSETMNSKIWTVAVLSLRDWVPNDPLNQMGIESYPCRHMHGNFAMHHIDHTMDSSLITWQRIGHAG